MLNIEILRLPVGTKFTARVEFCNMGTTPYNLGLRDGQIRDCIKNDNTNILVKMRGGKSFQFNNEPDGLMLELHEVVIC